MRCGVDAEHGVVLSNKAREPAFFLPLQCVVTQLNGISLAASIPRDCTSTVFQVLCDPVQVLSMPLQDYGLPIFSTSTIGSPSFYWFHDRERGKENYITRSSALCIVCDVMPWLQIIPAWNRGYIAPNSIISLEDYKAITGGARKLVFQFQADHSSRFPLLTVSTLYSLQSLAYYSPLCVFALEYLDIIVRGSELHFQMFMTGPQFFQSNYTQQQLCFSPYDMPWSEGIHGCNSYFGSSCVVILSLNFSTVMDTPEHRANLFIGVIIASDSTAKGFAFICVFEEHSYRSFLNFIHGLPQFSSSVINLPQLVPTFQFGF